MKKLFLFLFCILLIPSVVIALNIQQLDYDNFNDNSINSTLWTTIASCSGGGCVSTLAEANERIEIDSAVLDRTHTYKAIITSDNNVTHGFRFNVSKADTSCQLSGGSTYHSPKIFLDDQELSSIDSGGLGIYEINKTGDNKYTVYKDGSEVQNYSGLNSTIGKAQINLTYPGSGSGFPRATCIEIDDFYIYEDIEGILQSPNSTFELNNVTFNFTSISVFNTSLNNYTINIWNSTTLVFNYSSLITGSNNFTTISLNTGLDIGNYHWNVNYCLNNNQCDFTEYNLTFDYGFNVNSETYSATTTEGNSENYVLNITTGSTISTAEAVLYYNGTAYTSTKSGSGNNLAFTNTLTAPSVTANTNYTFYWQISLINSSDTYKFNTTTNTQQVNNINIDDCTSYNINVFNMTLLDEETQTVINGATYNTSVEVELNIYSLLDSVNPIINYTQNYSANNNPQICLQNDLGSSNYTMNLQVRYDGDEYASEFYHIQNSSLVNSTLGQQLNLYDLKDSSTQEFTITFKDENFLVVEDAIIQVQRKYISNGYSRTVEAPITDKLGKTLAHLQLNDVVYTFIVVKNGAILGTFNDVIAICQNPSLDTCEISLNSLSTGIEAEDYTTGDDFSYALSYVRATRTASTIFSVPSGSTATVLMNVTLLDGLGSTTACYDSLTSSSGTLSCVIPQNLGNGTAIVTISKDGLEVGKAFISLTQDPSDLYGSNLVFLGLFFIVTLIGVGLGSSPIISGVIMVLGFIGLIGFNLISTGANLFTGVATLMWLIVALILIIIKGNNR